MGGALPASWTWTDMEGEMLKHVVEYFFVKVSSFVLQGSDANEDGKLQKQEFFQIAQDKDAVQALKAHDFDHHFVTHTNIAGSMAGNIGAPRIPCMPSMNLLHSR